MLAWTGQLSGTEAAVWSLAVNALVFAVSLLLGHFGTRLGPKLADPPSVTRLEQWLAATCVVLNALVMWVGWRLFTANLLHVDDDPSVLRWLVDGVLLVLIMDVAMYVTHRLAHVPIIFRWVHGLHHRYDKPRALTLFVLHPLEVLGFGGLWIAVLCAHTYSLGGMLLYLVVNTLYGVFGHTSADVGNGRFHTEHHQHPTHNYGFYTPVWDWLFRTRFRPS